MPNILFTSIGRRVQLVRHFLTNGWNVVGVDINPEECAARKIVKSIYRVPRYDERTYLDKLIEICENEKINCIVPLYEPELINFSKAKRSFLKKGIRVLVPDEEPLSICLDKFNLFLFLQQYHFPMPDTYETIPSLNGGIKWVVKPRSGMGSKNVHIVSEEEVLPVFNKIEHPIVQRYISGQEYSIDVFINDFGQVLSVVPRLRLEVRSGEVSKSITTENKEIIELTVQLVQHLGLTGPATLQGIRESSTGLFYFIEVNPRFGGGVPLTIEAGIPYAEFIKETYRQDQGVLYPYQSGLKMLRYDEAIFVTERGQSGI